MMEYSRLSLHCPRPTLVYDQALVVCLEYFDNVAGRTDGCHTAGIRYFLMTYRIATDPDTQQSPHYALGVDDREQAQPWIR